MKKNGAYDTLRSMGQLIAILANRAIPMVNILEYEARISLSRPSEPPDGCGVGFYQRGEVLHKKKPRSPGQAIDWVDVVGDVVTDCAIVHFRKATVGDFRLENTHPFRMRQWQFAHTGTIHNFDDVRTDLLAKLPDFLARNVRGNTDSEVFFYLLLAHLHEDGTLDRTDVPLVSIRQAFDKTVKQIDAVSKFSVLNCVLTDGQRLFCLRRGARLSFVDRMLSEAPTSSASAKHPSALPMTTPLHYVLVTNSQTLSEQGYRELEENTLLVVNESLERQIFPLSS